VQWDFLGEDKFLMAYGMGLLAQGYIDSPLERMAYNNQTNFVSGVAPYDVEASVKENLKNSIVPYLDEIFKSL
jgi:hypothetical protein